MRSITGAALSVGLVLLSASEASANIFQINASKCPGKKPERTLTGFKLRGAGGGPDGIITALHGVAGCGLIMAVPDQGQPLTQALQLSELDVENDLALLTSGELSNKYPGGLEESTIPITANVTLRVQGHPLGIQSITTEVKTRPEPIVPLRRLLPPGDTFNALQQRLSPATSISVISIQGTILPGHSGAPILDASNRVVGVANGGLLNGSAQISWAVPIGNRYFTKRANNPILAQLAAADSSDLFSTGDGADSAPSAKSVQDRILAAIKQADVAALRNILTTGGIPQEIKNDALDYSMYADASEPIAADIVSTLVSNGARLRESALCEADTAEPKSIRLFARVVGVDPNYPCGVYGSPIFVVLRHQSSVGKAARVDALLSLPGINLSARNNESQTILIVAVQTTDAATVQAVLKHGNVNINATDWQGMTALHRAVRLDYGGLEMVRLLLSVNGINLNITEGSLKETPADAACKHPEVLRVLLDRGAKGNYYSGKELKECLQNR